MTFGSMKEKSRGYSRERKETMITTNEQNQSSCCQPKQTSTQPDPVFEKDPVCGMDVDAKTAQNTFDLKGVIYYFCNADCMNKFRANAENYLSDEISSAQKYDEKGCCS